MRRCCIWAGVGGLRAGIETALGVRLVRLSVSGSPVLGDFDEIPSDID